MSQTASNPWMGLRYYQEGQTIYGRTNEILVLGQKVINNTQTVVYGRSGIGKTSILNAGVYPVARKNGLFPVGVRLEHNSIPYINQIRKAVEKGIGHLRKDSYDDQGEKVTTFEEGSIEELVPAIDPEKETLWEYFHRHRFYDAQGRQIRPMVVFDQFEEIFTLEKNGRKITDFFSQLANLLNGVVPDYIAEATDDYANVSQVTEQKVGDDVFAFVDFDIPDESFERYTTDSEFHIVITLREDFLSHLERYSVDIPILKQNRYCLQAIDEEQAALIIMKPVPGIATKEVAKKIISKVIGDEDFELDDKPERQVDSAILSLYLSCLYDKMVEEGEEKITASLVDRFGDNIIQEFYEGSIKGISDSTVEYLENNLLNFDGRRENVSLTNALNIGKVPMEELDRLKDERLIRVFSYGQDLRIEYVHDILCPIINERREKRRIMREQAAAQQEMLLQEAKKREALEAQTRRFRRMIFSLLGAVAAAFLIAAILWIGYKRDYSECYAAFSTMDGWPVGVGKPIPSQAMDQYPVYYRLTRRGRFSRYKFDRVEVVNADRERMLNQFVESPTVSLDEMESTDEKAAAFAQLQRSVASWKYRQETGGRRVSEVLARDYDDNILYSVQFYDAMPPTDSTAVRWAVFFDKSGKAMPVRDNGLDRMRVSYLNGRETGYAFYSAMGSPQVNFENAFGYRYYALDPKSGQPLVSASLNEFGDVSRVDTLAWDICGMRVGAGSSRIQYGPDAVFTHHGDGRTDTLLFSERGVRKYLSSSDLPAALVGKDRIRCFYDAEGHREKLLCYSGGILDSMYVESRDGLTSTTLTWSPGRDYPYVAKKESGPEDEKVTAWFGGFSSEAVTIPIVYAGYHKEVKSISESGGLRMETYSYYDTEDRLYGAGEYASVQKTYDEEGRLLSDVQRDEDDKLYQSKGYEYDIYGALISSYVMGIDGTPVRCGSLDKDNGGASYYKMKFVEDFHGIYVSWKGENEFGEECYITNLDNPIVFRREIEANYVQDYQNSTGQKLWALPVAMEVVENLVAPVSVCYIHLLDKEGTAYRAGLRDGDLLLGLGSWSYRMGNAPVPVALWNETKAVSVKVARPNPAADSYDLLPVVLDEGTKGAEIYKVYFTDKEVERLKKRIEL